MDKNLFIFLLSSYSVQKGGVKPQTVAKIMMAMEHEFLTHPDGFAKHFGDDVADQVILDGFSWKKILEISRDTFNSGFAKIGLTYHSEEEFDQNSNGKDVFEGKYFYCRVKTTYKNRTFYYRNHTLVDSVIKAYQDQQNNLGLALAE